MNANGYILYRGPSRIDGEPIVAIVTGLVSPARNVKTGPMPQVYILRADMHPLQAVQVGADRSICGNCRHRGEVVRDPKTRRHKNRNRSCYVTLIHGPRMVYEAFVRGVYRPAPPARIRRMLTGRRVRIGAYGDPAAVPFDVWEIVLDKAEAVTGYTHLWREHPELSAFCMASCDTEAERTEAKALGFRTFRVRTKDAPVLKGEGQCPASKEMQNAVQCIACMLCGGNRNGAKADITLQVHGAGAANFEKLLA